MVEIASFEDLESLSFRNLKGYVVARLKLTIPHPPFDRSRDEEPEDFLIEARKGSQNPAFISTFDMITEQLLAREWKKLLNKKEHDSYYLSRLLILVETFCILGSHSTVLQMASNLNFLQAVPSVYGIDLYGQALRTLAFLQSGPTGYVERWILVFEDDRLSQYREMAFLGMRLCGIPEALLGLRLLMERARNDEVRALSVSISEFIFQYLGIKGIMEIVEDMTAAARRWDNYNARLRLCETCYYITLLADHLPRIAAEVMPQIYRPDPEEENEVSSGEDDFVPGPFRFQGDLAIADNWGCALNSDNMNHLIRAATSVRD